MAFSKQRGASKYFILCTLVCDNFTHGNKLLALRRQLAWEGLHAEADQFHATEDPEEIRQRVYALLAGLELQADITIFEKSKAIPERYATQDDFYKFAWYYHFKNVAKRRIRPGEDVLIQAASIGTKKMRQFFRSALNDVAQQLLAKSKWRTTFWSASTDPCLQVADYIAWAVQRKYERGDDRHYQLIAHHIASEFDMFQKSEIHYY